jgi:hypothetical protein
MVIREHKERHQPLLLFFVFSVIFVAKFPLPVCPEPKCAKKAAEIRWPPRTDGAHHKDHKDHKNHDRSFVIRPAFGFAFFAAQLRLFFVFFVIFVAKFRVAQLTTL